MGRVFISYSHDSDSHGQFVRALSDRLRGDGLDCCIDQYVNGFPPEGWQDWMERQIEAADFVLVVCTPLYLRRFRGEDPDGGRGVRFEGLILSNTLYGQFYCNTKFIPVIPDAGSLDDVPPRLKDYSVYRLSSDYLQLYRVLTAQPAVVPPSLGAIKILPPESPSVPSSPSHKITLDRLPTTRGKFFGREAELRLIDAAWTGDGTRIVQFIAPGGVGKTKLLRYWVDRTDSIEALLAWSFYSQGSSEDKQVSASPFFEAMFQALGSTRERFATEEERGEHLAELLRQRRCLLVLDGLEPLQHAGRGMRGELKDRAVRALLRSLAGGQPGLCVITSRIAVDDLRDRAHVVSRDLGNLVSADGVRLLRSLKVRGSDAELEQAVREYGCHALALSLLGNALATFEGGDVRRRDALLDLLDDGDPQSRHARRVMQAYAGWLADTPELRLLHLLGVFEYPIDAEVLAVLWKEAIPGLSDGLTERDWKRAMHELREHHHLLYDAEGPVDLFDCHPLIREYFGARLREEQPEAWRQAHERLYEYYKALPDKELPDTLEEMRPLFNAIAHGCAAELHQRAMDEIYWPRIRRKDDAYSIKQLGAFSDDLAVIAQFFDVLWYKPSAKLTDHWQALLLNWAGFYLRAVGRLYDAIEPMKAAVDIRVQERNWQSAAINAGNLSELLLSLGNVKKAIEIAAKSVELADNSEDGFWKMVNRAIHANALHQAGMIQSALTLFEAAEDLQKERPVSFSLLYSLRGYQYCDLLLTQGKAKEVMERSIKILEWTTQRSKLLLDIALNHLTLGYAQLNLATDPLKIDKAILEEKNEHLQQSKHWLEIAIIGLRNYGSYQHLSRGLLIRACFYRICGNFSKAYKDLDESFELAVGRENKVHVKDHLRLHLTDYHLEAARLALAEGKRAAATRHTEDAEKLIAATGYNRRVLELEELRAALAVDPLPPSPHD